MEHRRVPVEVTRLCTCWTNSVSPAGPSLSAALDAGCNVTARLLPKSRRRVTPAADDYPAFVTYPGLPRRIRKVGAPIGVIIALGTVTGLIVIRLTAVHPVGTGIGFALSSVAMTIVVL